MTIETAVDNDLFGSAISEYSRAQAIADGVLVDISQADGCKGKFKFPVAMTRGAWAATVEAGGTYRADGDEFETLDLPGGQDVAGRLHDVCWMLLQAILRDRRKAGGPSDRVTFSVLVDERGNGRHHKVDLYSICGPGDDGEPVITIMLPTED